MINNRQAGRRRGRGNNNGGGNGGGGGQRQGGGGGQGGRDSGNRIDSRARGNASQLYEKYKNLARDAQMQGDRVNIEYYLQFADHYFRVLSEQRNRLEESQPQTAPRPRIQQPFDLDGDDDYGDEGEPIRAGEQQNGGQQNGGHQNGGQQGGDQQNAQQNGQGNGRQDRDERPRYEGQRDGQRQRDDRPRGNRDDRRDDRAPREEQPRAEARDDSTRDAPRGEYRDAPTRVPRAPRNPAPVADGQVADGRVADEMQRPVVTEAVAPQRGDEPAAPIATGEDKPRRRGRPPRDRSAEAAATPAASAAPAEAAVDADRLPPSLGISAISDGATEEKPRRRRIRAPISETEAS